MGIVFKQLCLQVLGPGATDLGRISTAHSCPYPCLILFVQPIEARSLSLDCSGCSARVRNLTLRHLRTPDSALHPFVFGGHISIKKQQA